LVRHITVTLVKRTTPQAEHQIGGAAGAIPVAGYWQLSRIASQKRADVQRICLY